MWQLQFISKESLKRTKLGVEYKTISLNTQVQLISLNVQYAKILAKISNRTIIHDTNLNRISENLQVWRFV